MQIKFEKAFSLKSFLLSSLFVFIFLNSLAARKFATIEKIGGKTVVAGQTSFLNIREGIRVSGKAPPGTVVTIYNNNTSIGTGISGSSGEYSVNLHVLEGKENILSATADDGRLQSARGPWVRVIVDLIPPTGKCCVSLEDCGTELRYLNYKHRIFARWRDSGGSELDLESSEITVFNLTEGKKVWGTHLYENSGRIDYIPWPAWNETAADSPFKDKNKYEISTTIFDRAGNKATRIRQFYYDASAPPPVKITRIYDPSHINIFSGHGEPKTNLPDAEGWVDYYPEMTVQTQPTRIQGLVGGQPPVIDFNTGFETEKVVIEPASDSLKQGWLTRKKAYWWDGIDFKPVQQSFIDGLSGSFTTPFLVRSYSPGLHNIAIGAFDSAGLSSSEVIKLNFLHETDFKDFKGTGTIKSGSAQGLSVDSPVLLVQKNTILGQNNTIQTSDRHHKNNDPDHSFSLDSKIFFSMRPEKKVRAEKYTRIYYQISSRKDFTGIDKEDFIGLNSEIPPFDGVSGQTYYARVKAMDTLGNWLPYGPHSDGITILLTSSEVVQINAGSRTTAISNIVFNFKNIGRPDWFSLSEDRKALEKIEEISWTQMPSDFTLPFELGDGSKNFGKREFFFRFKFDNPEVFVFPPLSTPAISASIFYSTIKSDKRDWASKNKEQYDGYKKGKKRQNRHGRRGFSSGKSLRIKKP
ncbi:Ig-like domain-containing protein [Candidatus Riflebacteria bacterium]